MSMARWIYDTNSDVDVTFVHSARTPRDIIFHRELEFMSSRISNFHLHLICERLESGQNWSGYRGYLDDIKLLMITPDLHEREIFCCGPTPYMRAVKSILVKLGFNMEHYHEEAFGEAPAGVEEQAVQDAEIAAEEAELLTESDLIEVMFTESDKQVQVAPGETVHAAAAKAGLTIPKACGMGICGTCKVKKVSGDVEMSHNGGITDEDVADGYILSCCSVPNGNVVIEC